MREGLFFIIIFFIIIFIMSLKLALTTIKECFHSVQTALAQPCNFPLIISPSSENHDVARALDPQRFFHNFPRLRQVGVAFRLGCSRRISAVNVNQASANEFIFLPCVA